MTDQRKILIAEDEKPMARALEMKLNSAGFSAKAVFDGQQVMDELSADTYDLLLLDLMMPKMDGFAVLEKIKVEGITVPVIVLSNLSQQEDIKKSKELGAKDFFIKSDTSINEIVEKSKAALGM